MILHLQHLLTIQKTVPSFFKKKYINASRRAQQFSSHNYAKQECSQFPNIVKLVTLIAAILITMILEV